MCGSKPTDALRTLPERAIPSPGTAVAVGLCAVCLGLAVRLFFLQVRTDGFYADRAQGQQLRDTVVPADRGRIYSADGLLLAANSSCWTLRASPREMPEGKLTLAAKGLAEIWRWTKRSCWKNSATAAPTTAFSATGWTVPQPMPCGTSAKKTASPASASIRTPSAGTRRGSFWPRCWGLPMWTTQGSAGWN